MEPNKKLYRSRTERMIFGLCGGIGHYFNVDPTLIRILFVLLAMPGGAGVLVYLVASFVVPLEPGEAVDPKDEVKEFAHKMKDGMNGAKEEIKKHGHAGGRTFFGAIVIAIGFFLLAREIFPFYHFGMFLWPVLLILFGVYLLVKHQ